MQESIALLEGIDHPWHNSRSKMYLAQRAFMQGNFETARQYADEVVASFQEAGAILLATNYRSGIAHSLRQIGRLEEAGLIYRETLAAYQNYGHRGAIAHQLECFAFISTTKEQGERAVKLLSAANALRERVNSRRTPQEQMEYEKQIADLRAGLGEESFDRCWADGRSMTMEQAIQLALE
jgi:tetratricopeptide (TPR) repeat protein